jgi:ribokinase
MAKIVVVGSLSMDYTARVPKLPDPGESARAYEFLKNGGGKGANQAMAAAIFTSDIAMIGVVGLDPNGDALLEAMRVQGIDVRAISRTDVRTGTNLIYVSDSGKNMIVSHAGANAVLSVEHVEAQRALIKQAELLVVQLESPLDAIERAIDIAHQAKVPVLLNPSPPQPLDPATLAKVNYITPNEREVLKLTNSIEQSKGANTLRQWGVEHVIVTQGDRGSILKMEGKDARVESFKVSVIDTTAAGDAFSGALAAQLVLGQDVLSAMKIANATGALTTTRLGAHAALPTRDEVEALIQ